MSKGMNINIKDMLSNATPEDIDAITSSDIKISMNRRMVEKLSEAVIDNAGIVDEEELLRRENFRKAEKIRKIRNISICVVSVIAIFAILIGIGFAMKKDEDYTIYKSIWPRHEFLANGGDDYDTSKSYEDDLSEYLKDCTKLTFNASEIEEKTIENTLINQYFEYCDENDLVYDDYSVTDTEKYEKDDSVFYVYYCVLSVFNKQMEDSKIYSDAFIIVPDNQDFNDILIDLY